MHDVGNFSSLTKATKEWSETRGNSLFRISAAARAMFANRRHHFFVFSSSLLGPEVVGKSKPSSSTSGKGSLQYEKDEYFSWAVGLESDFNLVDSDVIKGGNIRSIMLLWLW